MRILRFIVRGQTILRDPACDFSGIVRKSKGYLRASFTFDEHWKGCKKAASFFDVKGNEFAAPIKIDGCMIPDDAVVGYEFKVSVTGKRDGYLISTNKVSVEQG